MTITTQHKHTPIADPIRTFWEQKYTSDVYLYGTQPNQFLVEYAHYLPPTGQLLCLAEGEGRNAVWLATQGFQVTAIDMAEAGLIKGKKLADQIGVNVEWIQADLAIFNPGQQQWDGIVSIFAHLPPSLRKQLHTQCVAALKPEGIMLLEGYSQQQLRYQTGGPSALDWLLTTELIQQELTDLTPLHLTQLERDIVEGVAHTGLGSVVQFIGKK